MRDVGQRECPNHADDGVHRPQERCRIIDRLKEQLHPSATDPPAVAVFDRFRPVFDRFRQQLSNCAFPGSVHVCTYEVRGLHWFR